MRQVSSLTKIFNISSMIFLSHMDTHYRVLQSHTVCNGGRGVQMFLSYLLCPPCILVTHFHSLSVSQSVPFCISEKFWQKALIKLYATFRDAKVTTYFISWWELEQALNRKLHSCGRKEYIGITLSIFPSYFASDFCLG